MTTYTSQYPPSQSGTYVKATTYYTGNFYPYFATDPAKSLTGTSENNAWASSSKENQRFHINLGSAKIIRRIYYENYHESGTLTNVGGNAFTLWGSNTAAAFAELTYGTDTNWTQLTIAQSTFDQHTAANQADPKYILVTNAIAYQYYALKIATNYGNASIMGLRRVELQTEDGYTPGGGFFPRIMIF